jgi:hypothetical protein
MTSEHRKIVEKKWYQKNRAVIIAKGIAYYKANREKIIRRRRFLRGGNVDAPILSYGDHTGRPKLEKRKYKIDVIKHYGGECYCCGEKNISFLSVEHINNNGKEHGTAKNRHKGEALYRYLFANNFPIGISIACFNCNIGRQNNGGVCPHKLKS